jgi:putative glycolipid-binding protein
VPLGRYAVLGDDGQPIGTELFRCAPGPMGWRYVSEIETAEPGPHVETVDVAVDADWRIARVRIDTGAHEVLLEPRGDTLAGTRDGGAIDLPWEADTHLDYLTPVMNLITCRRLPAAHETTMEIEVVYLEPVTLEPSIVRQGYDPQGPDEVDTPVGRFRADRWRFSWDAYCADIWVGGDVVVAYEALFDLVHYEPGATGVTPT